MISECVYILLFHRFLWYKQQRVGMPARTHIFIVTRVVLYIIPLESFFWSILNCIFLFFLLYIQLPEGVPAELTVSELEEMACRQQQQIESQRQLLVTKEQRLRFLQQHEAKHQMVAVEHERLRRLRDKKETQEQKLRKLRALRGQVDQTKLNNVSLCKYTT